MKNKWKWLALAAGFAVFALACIFGGQAMVKYIKAGQTAELQAEMDARAEEQRLRQEAEATPWVPPSLSPAAPSGVPGSAKSPGAVETAMPDVTIVEDEHGNQTITPNWKAKAEAAKANGVAAGMAPDANIGGGGGKLELNKDGMYEGDHPGEAPAPKPTVAPTPAPSVTPAPTPTQEPPGGAGQPQETDPAATPAPTQKPQPTPEVTPAPPSGGGANLPPDNGSRYNGEISPDGDYMWGEGFGWVKRGSGSYGVPENGPNTELSGEKVGEM